MCFHFMKWWAIFELRLVGSSIWKVLLKEIALFLHKDATSCWNEYKYTALMLYHSTYFKKMSKIDLEICP